MKIYLVIIALLSTSLLVFAAIQSTPASQTASDPTTDIRVAISRLEGRVDVIHTILDEREKQLISALKATEIATEKSEAAQRAVNVTQNEFRGTLKDQAALLATKGELEGLDKRVQNLEQGVAGGIGKSSANESMWEKIQPILTILSYVAIVFVFFWKQRPTEAKVPA